jgi:hypothetical protein
MIAARLTWIVVTGIAALLVVAAIDALRGSNASADSAEATP